MNSIDDEWSRYLNGDDNGTDIFNETDESNIKEEYTVPKCEDLYISTTTKVLFLNTTVDIDNIFWKLPVVEYGIPTNGIVKKQMKVVSKTPEEYEEYKKKIVDIDYYKEHIIKQIHNPSARRIKFKDERKITVGLSKKDIMNCRGKVKNAFYNCFAIIIRFLYENVYKEIHVKVFNTGKLEIPGILNNTLLEEVKDLIMNILKPLINNDICYIERDIEENVLINSNFNCGFYINRDKLYSIFRNKYRIETAYDPCSYPGVKCKFYYNNHKEHNTIEQKGLIDEEDQNMKLSELDDTLKYTEISFMIFRTGSCLIVGNCTEKTLRFVYEFIKNILYIEYKDVYVSSDVQPSKEKKQKLRKKTINITNDYFTELTS
tara:strand:- start:3468 stop:4589 length:1122 start_codon:yes stop_codon:yes gene_type:complete